MTLVVKRGGALHMLGRVRGNGALRLGRLSRRARVRLVRAVGVLALFGLLAHGLARLAPFPLCDQPPPTMHDPLGVRMRYERALLADAEYQLDLKPRVVTLWLWRIGVLPRQPDPQEAFADVRGIEAVALDQPDVFVDLWQLRLAYQQLASGARRDQPAPSAGPPDYAPLQVGEGGHGARARPPSAGPPDYAPLQTWLDNVEADLGASASVSVPDGVPGGPGHGASPQQEGGN
jgi:hypothetical protein